ncbi:hypothetical protein C8J56DRAFT_498547 [Mycena floridula]|nr:hypothetical protein C8J56DRAFT_498547 [Mycena floridula]
MKRILRARKASGSKSYVESSDSEPEPPSKRAKQRKAASPVEDSDAESALPIKPALKPTARPVATRPYSSQWYRGPRPHRQPQSGLLSLPAEIVDRIFGDQALNERDHLSLSGTCTAIRLGYCPEIWTAMADLRVPFSHNPFSYRLLQKPCNAEASATIYPDIVPAPPVARIWTNAIAAAGRNIPGIDFDAPCYKKKHKRCSCMSVMGQSHAQVISNVNALKTTWGHIYYHYQDLADLIDEEDFETANKSNPKGQRVEMMRLATVDAAILTAVGGPWAANKILVKTKGQKRKKLKRSD